MRWCAALVFLAPALAQAFVYPTKAASPELARTVSANLYHEYHGELRELRKAGGDASARIGERNASALAELLKTTGPGPGLTLEQARSVLETLQKHPSFGPDAISKYDPNREIGFCFGRAAFVHLELLARGVDPLNLRKAFALGQLRLAGSRRAWNFHVATLVRNAEGSGWWAIDDQAGRVLPVAEWIAETQKLDRAPAEPRTRFYFTDAVKFQPLPGAYEAKTLNQPLFGTYFGDLAKWFARR